MIKLSLTPKKSKATSKGLAEIDLLRPFTTVVMTEDEARKLISSLEDSITTVEKFGHDQTVCCEITLNLFGKID